MSSADPERALRTPRLLLEPQRAWHAEAMYALLCDPAIYRYENQPPASLEALHERFSKLETRRSGDGSEQWLNWVLKLADGRLAGYVQATVQPDGRAWIAYVLGSAHWGRGLAREAVEAMIDELASPRYAVRSLLAVYKAANLPSRRLLDRLGFETAAEDDALRADIDDDENLMHREVAATVRR